MAKIFTTLLWSLIIALFLLVAIIFNYLLFPSLGYWVFAIDLVVLGIFLALVSCLANYSIPGVKNLLKKEYFRVKFKFDKSGRSDALSKAYLRFLASLVVLFKSAEEGYAVIEEEAGEVHGKALLLIKKDKAHTLPKGGISDHLFKVHKNKQTRAGAFSAAFLFLLIAGGITTGAVTSAYFPSVHQSLAYTESEQEGNWILASNLGECGDYEVQKIQVDDIMTWTEAYSYCQNLCPTCELPNQEILSKCVCANEKNFGNNFKASSYWSSSSSSKKNNYAQSVSFGSCQKNSVSKDYGYYVRCIKY